MSIYYIFFIHLLGLEHSNELYARKFPHIHLLLFKILVAVAKTLERVQRNFLSDRES